MKIIYFSINCYNYIIKVLFHFSLLLIINFSLLFIINSLIWIIKIQSWLIMKVKMVKEICKITLPSTY